jgi:hypothetical protein
VGGYVEKMCVKVGSYVPMLGVDTGAAWVATLPAHMRCYCCVCCALRGYVRHEEEGSGILLLDARYFVHVTSYPPHLIMVQT